MALLSHGLMDLRIGSKTDYFTEKMDQLLNATMEVKYGGKMESKSENNLAELLILNRSEINGTIRYYNNKGRLHRIHGPAVIRKYGNTVWYCDGLRHRDGGPACINNSIGYEEWYRAGKLHREDGPAVIFHNGDVEYWINGVEIKNPDLIKFHSLYRNIHIRS